MNIGTFKYDANNASVLKEEKRTDAKGDVVVRLTLDNGVIFVYTQTNNGFERLDTNFVLVKQSNGYYKSDLNEPKRDFDDYY